MNNFLFNSQSEVDVNSPSEVTNASLCYFDLITQRLDSWHASQQAIKAQKQALVKTFLLQDVDEVTGETKIYRLSLELIRTMATPLEQIDIDVDAHQLELMEGSNYVS